jgi:glucosyl-3-phosphoglycerate synthase
VTRTAHALDAWDWFRRRTFHHSRFADAGALLRTKEERGCSVSVCLPTRNEADTVGDIVRAIGRDLVEAVPLVDEIVVVDAASADGTSGLAAEAGAVVSDVDGRPWTIRSDSIVAAATPSLHDDLVALVQ